MRDERNYSLKEHNTFGIDARCRRYVEVASVEEALTFVKSLTEPVPGDLPLLIVGGGSNLLLTADYPGTVLRSAIGGISFSLQADDSVLVEAGSGVEWDKLVAVCVKKGCHGMENLSLIPGDVGASAVQNIGAYGVEACDLIMSVKAIELRTGRQVEISADECQYAYRHSRFKTEWKGRYFITSVVYRLSTVFKPRLDYGNIREQLQRQGITEPTAQQLRDVIVAIRQDKLPDHHVMGNAGSFFMNPVVDSEKFRELSALYPLMPHYTVGEGREKIPAAWLIDQCGWKGRTMGRAGVYVKQPLVLVNLGGASGSEVVALCQSICDDVWQRFGIRLNPEVNII